MTVRHRGVTIEQLARELNLAKSTVSRALNGYPDIAEETRQRVEQAALARGYRASSAARTLKRGQVDTVGIVLPGEGLDIASPFLVQFLRGATRALERRGIDLLVAHAINPESWRVTYDRLITSRKVDGFILTWVLVDDPRPDYLTGAGVPFVAFGRTAGADGFAWLDVDGAGAMDAALEHLSQLGHSRVGLVGAADNVNIIRKRREAFETGVARLGLEADPALAVKAGRTFEDGRAGAERLLALDRPPTALVCDIDPLAFGALRALHDLGLVAGEDVSVLGYGDVPFADVHTPPLSTFSQDAENAGAWIAEMLCAVMTGTDPQVLQRLRPATLVRRATDGRPVGGCESLRAKLDRAA